MYITLSTKVHVDQLSVAGDLRTALLKHQITVQIQARTLCPNTTVIEPDKGIFCSCRKFPASYWSPGRFSMTSLYLAVCRAWSWCWSAQQCEVRSRAKHLPLLSLQIYFSPPLLTVASEVHQNGSQADSPVETTKYFE